MVEYSVVQEHEESNLTLLCATHHQDKTSGRLTPDKVRDFNASPYNLGQGHSSPWTMFTGSGPYTIGLAGNSFTHSRGNFLIALGVDNYPLLAFRREEGAVLVTALLLDGDNNPILWIKDNEVIVTTSPWDVETAGRMITIRYGSRRIWLELEFAPPDALLIHRGIFFRNGITMNFDRTGWIDRENDIQVSGCFFDGPVGLAIGRWDFPAGAGVRVDVVSRGPLVLPGQPTAEQ